MNIFSLLPESARWMISKGHYKKAEELLRKMAKINKRTFDEEAFQKLIKTQEEVNNKNIPKTASQKTYDIIQ